jgi:peptidoglycan/LPS O-acetylase OafA/YrhL
VRSFDHVGYFLPAGIQAAVNQWFNPGDHGIFVFFLISGYIVPASLERKGSVRTFWVGRLFRLYPLVAEMVVLTGLAFAVALRGVPRFLGAVLAALVGLTLLAFNGTWLSPWDALSILALMFTGTMLYRAVQGQYPWRAAIAVAVTVLGLAIASGLWHEGGGLYGPWQRSWITTLLLAGLTFGAGLALRNVRWPRFLTWLGLISYSVYLLHPALIEVYGHLAWTSAHYSFWPQLLVVASFLAILIAVCSLTYLFVERPMQNVGRRLARRRDPSGRITSAVRACWCHGSAIRARIIGRPAAAAPRAGSAVPGLPGLPRQHLPVADGRDRAARLAGRGRPAGRDRAGQRGHRGLARGRADVPAGPDGAGRPRLRRFRAPGQAGPAVLARRPRPGAGHGRA